MQDRFKFRAWNKEFKKFLVHNKEDKTFSLHIFEDICESNRYEVLQCTGLKDKYGKLIFEGDIVKINENYPDYSIINDFYKKQNFVVEYFQPQATYLLKPSEYEDNSGDGIYDLSPNFYEFLNWKPTGKLEENSLQGIEILGNVYENPELLKDNE